MDAETKKIVAEYELYKSLVYDEKFAVSSSIPLTTDNGHRNKFSGELSLTHSSYTKEITLHAEIRDSAPQDTAFKIFVSDLTRTPIFRYDGDGSCHENRLDTLPLNQRNISTPHFHYFHHTGVSLAYKSKVLLNPTKCECILNDVNFALAHFYKEATIGVKGSPQLDYNKPQQLELFERNEFDPLDDFGIIGEPI